MAVLCSKWNCSCILCSQRQRWMSMRWLQISWSNTPRSQCYEEPIRVSWLLSFAKTKQWVKMIFMWTFIFRSRAGLESCTCMHVNLHSKRGSKYRAFELNGKFICQKRNSTLVDFLTGWSQCEIIYFGYGEAKQCPRGKMIARMCAGNSKKLTVCSSSKDQKNYIECCRSLFFFIWTYRSILCRMRVVFWIIVALWFPDEERPVNTERCFWDVKHKKKNSWERHENICIEGYVWPCDSQNVCYCNEGTDPLQPFFWFSGLEWSLCRQIQLQMWLEFDSWNWPGNAVLQISRNHWREYLPMTVFSSLQSLPWKECFDNVVAHETLGVCLQIFSFKHIHRISKQWALSCAWVSRTAPFNALCFICALCSCQSK